MPKISRELWVIVIFRFVLYLLNFICLDFNLNTISHILKPLYNSDTVLNQFLETGTSEELLSGSNPQISRL